MSNEMKHTPEPWVSRLEEMGGYDCMTDAAHIIGPDGTNIATLDAQYYGQENCRPQPIEGAVLMEFNAARIVDCVNACEGMDDPAARIEELRADLREALDALELLRMDVRGLPYRRSHDGADAVLAKHGRAV